MSHRWDFTVRPNTHISPPPFRGYNPFPSRFQTDMLPATKTHISVWQSHKRGMTLQQTPAVPHPTLIPSRSRRYSNSLHPRRDETTAK